MSDTGEAASAEVLRFPCKACGAKLAFAPGATQLECGYCGHTEAIALARAEVSEHDFEDYKPDASGYGDMVNGQTGEVAGHAPYSWLKITAFVAVLIAIFGVIAYFQTQ